MARATLSTIFKRAAFAEQTGEAIVVLVSIYHLEIPGDHYIRVCRYGDVVTSQGYTFQPVPFEIVFPLDSADELGQTTVQIDNVSADIIKTIETLSSKPTITVQVIVQSDPNNVQFSYDLQMLEVKYDRQLITGTLAWENFLNEPYPCDDVTPGNMPGVFAIRS